MMVWYDNYYTDIINEHKVNDVANDGWCFYMIKQGEPLVPFMGADMAQRAASNWGSHLGAEKYGAAKGRTNTCSTPRLCLLLHSAAK